MGHHSKKLFRDLYFEQGWILIRLKRLLSVSVGFLHFDALENPIIFARSTDYRPNYFFRYSKLRKSVKTAEKAN